MKEQIDMMMTPSAAIPVTGGISLMNAFMDNLPGIINIATMVYLVLLIVHKGWTMYSEWKKIREENTKGESIK